MPVGIEQGAHNTQSSMESERCLLLIRAPSDRSIYEAFRALAERGRSRLTEEHLYIEGDIPLTPALSAPVPPATLERLLEADCEMIDKLELQFGTLQITYVRSGGHAPYRESFFDEVQLETDTAADPGLVALIELLFDKLSITSHAGTPPLSDLVGQIAARRRDIAKDRMGETSSHAQRLP